MLTHEVTLFEVDLFAHLRPSYLLRYALQACSVQLIEEGSAARVASGLQNRTGWMLARLILEEQKPVFEGDTLEFHCSYRQQNGAAYLRELHVLRAGEEVATCRMLWMLVDLDARRILRPKELEPLFEGIPAAENIAPVPRVTLPKELPMQKSHRVLFSECDKNGHYSSPNYIDLICDVFDFWKDGEKHFRSLEIEYHSEFLPEEEIELLGENADGCITVRGQHTDGKIGFAAILKTE